MTTKVAHMDITHAWIQKRISQLVLANNTRVKIVSPKWASCTLIDRQVMFLRSQANRGTTRKVSPPTKNVMVEMRGPNG